MEGYSQREAAKNSGVAQTKLSRLKKSGAIVPDLPDGKYSAALIDKIRAEYGKPVSADNSPVDAQEAAQATEMPADEQTPVADETPAQIVSKENLPTQNETDTITIEVPFKLVTLDERAARIRKLSADVQRGIIEIGNELIAAKRDMGHGNWGTWLKNEFDWTQQTANRFMRVADRFGKLNTGVQFKSATLQAMLALPFGTEQEFIDEQAAKGKPVEEMTKREVQSAVKEFNRQREEELNTLANGGDSNAEYGGAQNFDNATGQIPPETFSPAETNDTIAPADDNQIGDSAAESPIRDEQGETDDENKSNAAGDEWFTPSEYIEAARRVFGGTIDLDPASCEKANEIVKATKIYTKENSGLNEYWEGNVWMNPPYSKGLIDQFVDKIIYSGGVTAAIVLTDNKTDTKWFLELARWSSAMIFTVGRVDFLHGGKLEKGKHRRGQAIFYLGDEPQKFLDEFQKFGWTAKFVAPPTE